MQQKNAVFGASAVVLGFAALTPTISGKGIGNATNPHTPQASSITLPTWLSTITGVWKYVSSGSVPYLSRMNWRHSSV